MNLYKYQHTSQPNAEPLLLMLNSYFITSKKGHAKACPFALNYCRTSPSPTFVVIALYNLVSLGNSSIKGIISFPLYINP